MEPILLKNLPPVAKIGEKRDSCIFSHFRMGAVCFYGFPSHPCLNQIIHAKYVHSRKLVFCVRFLLKFQFCNDFSSNWFAFNIPYCLTRNLHKSCNYLHVLACTFFPVSHSEFDLITFSY